MVDLNLNLDGFRVFIIFQLFPQPLDLVEPDLMRLVRVVLQVVTVLAKLGLLHDHCTDRHLEELKELIDRGFFSAVPLNIAATG